MGKRDLDIIKKDLRDLPPTQFITKWIFEHIPFVFDDDKQGYILWRTGIAKRLRIDPSDIFISGSASLGFSTSPKKNFKEFNATSDIDVCIISHHYFEVAWHDLFFMTQRNLPPNMVTAIEDHRTRLIYWGTIATDKILPLLSFGPEWDRIINQSKKTFALQDREIHFRIYKDRVAARKYLSISIENRKNALLEEFAE